VSRLGRLVAAAGTAVVVAGCGIVGGNGFTATPTTTPGVTLSTETSPVGRILATGSGHTLYAFAPDTASHSACVSATCTYVWPPLIAHGTPTVAHGLRASLVGTIRRAGGARQVTYGGHPLYTYVTDPAPGAVMGQALDQSGGYWYVVAPSGRIVTSGFTVVPKA